MKKEPKSKCKYCRARHRQSFMLHFPDKSVCLDCACEYRKIFFGFKNRDARRSRPKVIEDVLEKYEQSQESWTEHFTKSCFETPWPGGNPFKMYSKPPEEDGISEDS